MKSVRKGPENNADKGMVFYDHFRWFNQLDPEIKKSEEWSEEEKSKVLKLHNCFGNKWSLIAKNLEGRTDNSVKNFINSNLRKGLRLLNLYISKNKKFSDFRFRNLKEYKTDLLTKILLFSGENETFHDQVSLFIISRNIRSAFIIVRSTNTRF